IAEVYETIGFMQEDDDEHLQSKKDLLKEFCNLIWKHLEERSKPKSSCLI
ncbi:unnamed protein product, partial [Didymodactylos carnosus]